MTLHTRPSPPPRAVDTYGTQQPIALLHFLVGRGHMYDRSGKDLDLRTFKDLQFLGAMGPPGGGRNNVDPRFVALFSVFNLTPPNADVLTRIYGSILMTYVEPFSESVKEAASHITASTLQLYASVIEKLPPTPSKFHYIFNLRDLGRVYEGLCTATPDVITTGEQLVRLWRNECLRIFGDRVVSESDSALVAGLISSLTNANFGDAASFALRDPLVFGDYRNAVERITEEKEDARLYQDLGSYAEVRTILDQVLEAYNSDSSRKVRGGAWGGSGGVER